MPYGELNYEELAELSDKERELAINILKQYSKKGSSEDFNKLLYEDYEEIPVDIETFIYDPKYLGRGLIDEEGRKTVFPFWVEKLKEIFPDNLTTSCRTLVLSGAIGIGKTLIAVLCILYQLYRMMCLKDPYLYYELQPIDKITFSFMNITLDASKGVGWDKAQQLLQSSQWFRERGTIKGTTNILWYPPKDIELIPGSQSRHIIGRAVFSSFFDEISWIPNQDIEKQKIKASNLINTASARMESRFMKGEKNPTLLILASSKRTEQSFLETFIEQKKKNARGTTKVIDEPQWVVRTDKDSKNKFKVALGNKFLDSEVLPLSISEHDLSIYRDKGFKILEIPMGYYESFIDDINIALTDIAGISVTNLSSYINGVRLAKCKSVEFKNAFTKDIIVVGNDKNDLAQYSDFFNLEAIDPKYKRFPLYIHYDMSISGDKTGLAGAFTVAKRPPTELNVPQSRELIFMIPFVVSIKAPKGHQISFEKNRQFIYWLKEQGFNIKGVSSDTFQSYDTGQALKAKGYSYDIISVDRVNRDHICEPYQYLRSCIYEERISIPHNNLLTEELLGLRRDANGKIDHDPSGINSKDSADAVCGSIFNASKNAEQFAFEFGEMLETITTVSSQASSPASLKKQVQVEFEQELQRVMDPIARQKARFEKQLAIENAKPKEERKKIESPFTDFGLGKATDEYKLKYIDDNIVLW